MTSPDRARVRRDIVLLAALDLVVFADVLLMGGSRVPLSGDVEIHARYLDFAASHLRRGELPLWNPHVFCGTPALGNPNAMTLYPPNLLAVVLPLPAALAWWTFLHTLLVGAATYLWVVRRGLHPLGALLAGVMVSFGAPFFAHVYAGHMSAVAAMAWTPALLLAVDELLRRPSLGWIAAVAVVVAMQMLGGHPQYLLYAFIAAVFSIVLQRPTLRRGTMALASLALGVVWAAGLAAAQLVVVADAMAEAFRPGRLDFDAVSKFSMSWPALITLAVPGFFGPPDAHEYWGYGYFWEVTPFIGGVGLVAAVIGAARGDRAKRRGAATLAAMFLVLALGSNTPLLRGLYDYVPPFDRFRASGRALFPFSLFAAMLAAAGIDVLARERVASRAVPVLLAVAVTLASFGVWVWVDVSREEVATVRGDVEAMLRLPPAAREQRILELARGDPTRVEALERVARARDGIAVSDPRLRQRALLAYVQPFVEALSVNRWQALRNRLSPRGRFVHPLDEWADPANGRRQALGAVEGLMVAAALCVATALLLRRTRISVDAVRALGLLGVAELACFAWMARASYDVAPPKALAAFYEGHAGDQRVHATTRTNMAMSLGARDIWGYDPLVSARYAAYVALTQGTTPAVEVMASVALGRAHRSFGMLRLAWVLDTDKDPPQLLAGPSSLPPPLSALLLVHDFVIASSPEQALGMIDSPDWDPGRTVILESPPDPVPATGDHGGSVALLDESTDHLTIEADLPAPALLLVTDAYSRRWRASPLAGSAQSAYTVLPADYVLRAVPLAAGHHRIRMEYVPRGYGAGIAASAAALLLLAGTLVRAGRRR